MSSGNYLFKDRHHIIMWWFEILLNNIIKNDRNSVQKFW